MKELGISDSLIFEDFLFIVAVVAIDVLVSEVIVATVLVVIMRDVSQVNPEKIRALILE